MQDATTVVAWLVLGAMLAYFLFLCLDLLSTPTSPQIVPPSLRKEEPRARGRQGSVECVADLEMQCTGSDPSVGRDLASRGRIAGRVAGVRASMAVSSPARTPSLPVAECAESIPMRDLHPIAFENPFEGRAKAHVHVPSHEYSPFTSYTPATNPFSKHFRPSRLAKVGESNITPTAGDAVLGSPSFFAPGSLSSAANGAPTGYVDNPYVIDIGPDPTARKHPGAVSVAPHQGELLLDPQSLVLDGEFEDVYVDRPPAPPSRRGTRWESPRVAPRPSASSLPGRDLLKRFSRR